MRTRIKEYQSSHLHSTRYRPEYSPFKRFPLWIGIPISVSSASGFHYYSEDISEAKKAIDDFLERKKNNEKYPKHEVVKYP